MAYRNHKELWPAAWNADCDYHGNHHTISTKNHHVGWPAPPFRAATTMAATTTTISFWPAAYSADCDYHGNHHTISIECPI